MSRKSREAIAAVVERSDARRRAVWLGVLLAIVTVVAFSPVLGNKFVAFDDMEAIVSNADYNPPALAKFRHFWTEPLPDLYTPVMWTVWGLLAFSARTEPAGGAAAAGAAPQWDPTPFHALNLAAHVGAALMAFTVLRKLVRSERAAFFGAAVFALHPIQAEAVAWAAAMKTPLSGLLALWATWHYLRFSELRDDSSGEVAENAARRSWLHYAAACVLFLLALFTKPTVVVLPVIIAILETILRGRRVRDVAIPLLPWLLVAVAVGRLNSAAQPAQFVFRPAVWQRGLLALDSFSFYLFKLFAPFPLLPDYSRTPDVVVGGSHLWIDCIPAALLVLAAMSFWRKVPSIAAATGVFLLGVVTTVGLISYDYQIYTTVADRYAYLSMLGPAIVVAYVLRSRLRHRLTVIVSCVLLGCAALTFVQCLHWRDTQTLFAYTLRLNPRSLAAYRSLGFAAYANNRLGETLDVAKIGLGYHPGDPILLQFVGNAQMRDGKFDDAAAAFREASVRSGNREQPLYSLGVALAESGHTDDAEAAFREAAKLKPEFTPAYEGLAILNIKRGMPEVALLNLGEALRYDPESPKAQSLVPYVKALIQAKSQRPATTRAAALRPR